MFGDSVKVQSWALIVLRLGGYEFHQQFSRALAAQKTKQDKNKVEMMSDGSLQNFEAELWEQQQQQQQQKQQKHMSLPFFTLILNSPAIWSLVSLELEPSDTFWRKRRGEDSCKRSE